MKIKTIDYKKFDELIDQGYNCKMLAEYFNISVGEFGKKVKKEIGIYPSIYIHQRREKNSV
jgi:hypothetical protein